ncbi:MAG: hypothetical protein RR290_00230 [Clostridia bacterium]
MIIAAPICDTMGVNICFIIFGIIAAICGISPLFVKDIMNIENDNLEEVNEQKVLE